MYTIYMLRCQDNSIYTGITTDLKRRAQEHLQGVETNSKYTATHKAQKIECAWSCENRAEASKLEYWIKKLNKQQKEKLIEDKNLENAVGKKLDYKIYKLVPKTKAFST